MKKRIIQPAPSIDGLAIEEMMAVYSELSKLTEVLQRANNEYLYWDDFRYLKLPEDIKPENAWRALKFTRQGQLSKLPFTDTRGKQFGFWLPDSAQRSLHNIDRRAPGLIGSELPVINEASKRRYLVSSLMEEAIASSQIEGAATTRKVAKELLRTGRKPVNKTEKMIVNNYQTIQKLVKLKDEKLSPEMLLELQTSMVKNTIDPGDVGRLRNDNDGISVIDSASHEILHIPPAERELKNQIELLCEFANTEKHDQRFIHPVIKGILLHFWLAYIHPFVDGNGRTARALFYWHMLAHGYWLFEYLSISKHILSSRGQYEKAFLYAEQDDNDATYFIIYHLNAIEKALVSLEQYLAKKQSEYREMTQLLLRNNLGLNYRQQALVKHALANSGFAYTVESHRNSHGISAPTARNDLIGLSTMGLLIQMAAGKKQYFLAPDNLAEIISRDCSQS